MSKIVFSNIYKSFKQRPILRGAEITLHTGQCFLLTGPNGAGKSTLQRICAGLEKPDKGLVDTGNGARPWKQQRHSIENACVYLHQQPYMFDGTVAQNLAYGLPRQTPKTVRQERVELALDWAGLGPIADCWAKTLSGGERQRVALARAWLSQPRYMLLDEPTNNLDENAKQRTIALLLSLKAQGIALLITSHEAEHFISIADGWYALAQGVIIDRQLDSNIVPITKTQQVR